MARTPSVEEIRDVVGVELTTEDAQALADLYATLAEKAAAFPAHDLKQVEPPLRSTPGPRR